MITAARTNGSPRRLRRPRGPPTCPGDRVHRRGRVDDDQRDAVVRSLDANIPSRDRRVAADKPSGRARTRRANRRTARRRCEGPPRETAPDRFPWSVPLLSDEWTKEKRTRAVGADFFSGRRSQTFSRFGESRTGQLQSHTIRLGDRIFVKESAIFFRLQHERSRTGAFGVDGSQGHVSRVSHIFWRRTAAPTRDATRALALAREPTVRPPSVLVQSRLFRVREAGVVRAFAGAGGITDKRRSVRLAAPHAFARAFRAPGGRWRSSKPVRVRRNLRP